MRQGVIRSWAPGRYGLPEGVTAEELAHAIDGDAYVTAGYALARHGFITQQPREIDCFTRFTRRRHNRSRRRSTPLGGLVFICVSPRLERLTIPAAVRSRYPRSVQRAVEPLVASEP